MHFGVGVIQVNRAKKLGAEQEKGECRATAEHQIDGDAPEHEKEDIPTDVQNTVCQLGGKGGKMFLLRTQKTEQEPSAVKTGDGKQIQ